MEVQKYSDMQNLFVNIVIVLLENIKYHLFYLRISPQKISDRLYRNLSRFFLRKMKFACGDTAKGNTL